VKGNAMISCLHTKDRTINQTLQAFFVQVLEKKAADAVLVSAQVADGASVKPCLISHPDHMHHTVPLGPAFFVNTGRMVSRLTWKPSGKKTAVWLRPCEIKAFVELTKLSQASRDEVIILGMDCPGALSREDYDRFAQQEKTDPVAQEEWIRNRYSDPGNTIAGFTPARACQVCDAPWPVNADVSVLLFGSDLDRTINLKADTPKGEAFLSELQLDEGQKPDTRKSVMQNIGTENANAFQAMDAQIQEQTGSMEKLHRFFTACINCYNCRNVCPACYCRECVFNTDVFVHQPFQYHQWAGKWGQVHLPFDTVFYHMTRMAHIGTTCVGCGQCTLACPSHIPLADLFISVSRNVQAAFGYTPGKDDADPLPLAVFQEAEFPEIVGMGEGEAT